ncbi:hypothetical protein DUI87_31146 [Hirundo rustica rustica]|uniref:Uncharacterized protein n=1 Tax=Hirundo rustica rustica TaxID=333673 RepID=A0A3M0J0X2_HIRRU|nr:hypothetical protein DUI87_31146 [Hirundo rustica rustica]
MAQAVSVGELGLPQLELLKGQLEQEVEFLSSSLAQLKVVQTKFVEAKECLNVLHKGNEVCRRRPGIFKRKIEFLTRQMEKIQPALQEKHAMKQAVLEMMTQKLQQLTASQGVPGAAKA